MVLDFPDWRIGYDDTQLIVQQDDTIDVMIAGADDFQFEANILHALSGSVFQQDDLTAGRVLLVGAAGILADDESLAFDGDQLAMSTQGATGGILVGGDALLYRSNADEFTTPDSLIIGGSLTAAGATLTVGLLLDNTTTGSTVDSPWLWFRGNYFDGSDYEVEAKMALVVAADPYFLFQIDATAVGGVSTEVLRVFSDGITLADTKAIRTGVADNDYFSLAAYDKDDATYRNLIRVQGGVNIPYIIVEGDTNVAFRDLDLAIWSGGDSFLDIKADGAVRITAPTFNVSGLLDVETGADIEGAVTIDLNGSTVLDVTREQTGPSGFPQQVLRLNAKATGDMSDGFGAGITFNIADDVQVAINIASIRGVRSGDDISGALEFYVDSNDQLALTLNPNKSAVFGAGATFVGQVNIETSASATMQLRSVTDDAILILDSGDDGGIEQSMVLFRADRSTKWTLVKNASNAFIFRDEVNANDIFTATPGVTSLMTWADVTHTGFVSSGDLILDNPTTGSTAHSPELYLQGNYWDGSDHDVQGSFQLVSAADPYIQVQVSDDGATPVLTTAMQIFDTTVLFSGGATLAGILVMSNNSITGTHHISVTNAAGAQIMNEAATSTNPTFIPNRADLDTGIGWLAADQLSLVAGGKMLMQITEGGVSGNTVIIFGDTITGGAVGQRTFEVLTTLNDSGAPGTNTYTMIKGNVVETDITGWTTINLIDLQVDGVPKFTVDRTGAMTLGAGATFAGDVLIGANLLKTTNHAIKQIDATWLGVRDAADTDYSGLAVQFFEIRSGGYISLSGNGDQIRGPNTDGHYASITARDTGVGLVEVARIAGAADPYFAIGGSQQYKFYNSGLFTLNDESSISTTSNNNDYYVFKAYDTGVGLVEVGRVVGAADPHVALGGSQEFKFTNAGLFGAYSVTPVAQPAHIADATDAASAITQLNLLIAAAETLGWVANA